MSENGIKDFDSLKATPCTEFWRLYELLQKKLEKEKTKSK